MAASEKMMVRKRRVYDNLELLNRPSVYPGLTSRKHLIEIKLSYVKQKMVAEIDGRLRICALLGYTIFMMPFVISYAYNLIVPLILWNNKKMKLVASLLAIFPFIIGVAVNPPLLFFVLVKVSRTKELNQSDGENHVRNLTEFLTMLSFSMKIFLIGLSSRILFDCAARFIYFKFTFYPNCGRHRCPLPTRLNWVHIKQTFSHLDWDLVTFSSRQLLGNLPRAVVISLLISYFRVALDLTMFEIVPNQEKPSLQKFVRILRPYNFLIVALHLTGLLLFQFEAFYFWQIILPKGARQLYYSNDYLGRVLDTIASLVAFKHAKSDTR